MVNRWREPWLVLSSVNLLFFRRWAEVLPGGHDYFLKSPRSPAAYLSLIFLVLVVSALAWGALVLVRRLDRPRLTVAMRGTFVLVAGLGLWGIIVEAWVFLGRPEVGQWLVAGLIASASGVFGWLQWRKPGWHRRLVPVAVMFILIVSPLTPLLFAQGAYQGLLPGATAARFTPGLAGMVDEGDADDRLVVLVFDELDQRLLFEDRPEDLHLPAFDRLRNDSLHATHAYAPNAATLRSIPSMTTGRFVESAQPHSIDGNLLRFRDSDERREWKETPTLFDDARDAGMDVGIVGTYHPYCRIFDGVVSKCVFESHYTPEPAGWGDLLVEHVFNWFDKLPTDPIADDLRGVVGTAEPIIQARQEREIRKVQTLSAAAEQMVADPELDLVFVHINAPHPSGIRGDGRGYFDAATGTFTTGPEPDYFDGLALADSVLARMRSALEDGGVWNRTTLLVTSDHGHRAELWHADPQDGPAADPLQQMTDHRVVFLLKPRDAGPALSYTQPFNIVVLRELARAVLQEGATSAAAQAEWLDQIGTGGPAPYYKVR